MTQSVLHPELRPELHATPRLRDVAGEQIRAVGLVLRRPLAGLAAVAAAVTLIIVVHEIGGGEIIDFHPELSMLPAMAGFLLPLGVWKGERRFGPSFLWSLPVDHRRHALVKVGAGWVWLMAGVLVFMLWLLGLTLLSGGKILAEEAMRLLPATLPPSGALDPAALRTVRWAPTPLFWLVPFTAATGTYLLASALVVGLRHPLRWVIGAVVGIGLLSATVEAANAERVADVAELVAKPLLYGPYGLDALFTARTESLHTEALLSTGERVAVWRGLPDLRQWAAATLLWTGLGLAALWAAASRHRERRGA